ncbi:MAG: glycosyltransferase family 4 protein [Acidimicrobiia bacterium]|nr:glycosyltransferase family 4 protein [Acidimicrobiia bacterium]
MRVVLVTNDFPPKAGGIQQYLGNIVARHDGPITVLAPADARAGTAPDVFRGDGQWMVPTRAVKEWISAHVTAVGADVVVYGAPTPLAQAGPTIRRRTRVPFVVMTHGAEVTLPAMLPGARQFLRHTFQAADGIFAVSRYTAAQVSSIARVPATVLGAGVDIEAFRPGTPTTDGITIGCVSRFIPRKGHIRVIEASEELARRGRNVNVLIVGRGRLETRIRRRAAAATVPVRIEVDVPWTELPRIYTEMDVFVMPARSRWAGREVEGLGIVYLEAAASGLPVVAGRSGGAPETITPGQTGYMAESVDEIVEAVEQILLRPEMGHAGRRRIMEDWTWDSVMERWQQGLADAIQNGS